MLSLFMALHLTATLEMNLRKMMILMRRRKAILQTTTEALHHHRKGIMYPKTLHHHQEGVNLVPRVHPVGLKRIQTSRSQKSIKTTKQKISFSVICENKMLPHSKPGAHAHASCSRPSITPLDSSSPEITQILIPVFGLPAFLERQWNQQFIRTAHQSLQQACFNQENDQNDRQPPTQISSTNLSTQSARWSNSIAQKKVGGKRKRSELERVVKLDMLIACSMFEVPQRTKSWTGYCNQRKLLPT